MRRGDGRLVPIKKRLGDGVELFRGQVPDIFRDGELAAGMRRGRGRDLGTQWTDVFFRFYPSFSRWILGVLAGITSVTAFPLWEPGLCLIVLWGVISLIRSLVRHHFLRWHVAYPKVIYKDASA